MSFMREPSGVSALLNISTLTISVAMETLPFEIGETAHALRKAFDRLAVGLGVTRAQWKVLFRLTRTPGLRQVELADMLDHRADHFVPDRRPARGSRAGRAHARSRRPPRVAAARHRAGAAADREASGDRRRAGRAGVCAESTRRTSRSRGRCWRGSARTPAAARRNQQGVEPMNKMSTETMTGDGRGSAGARRQARPAGASASLRTDPDADRAGAAAARRRLLLADQRRQRVDRRRRR